MVEPVVAIRRPTEAWPGDRRGGAVDADGHGATGDVRLLLVVLDLTGRSSCPGCRREMSVVAVTASLGDRLGVTGVVTVPGRARPVRGYHAAQSVGASRGAPIAKRWRHGLRDAGERERRRHSQHHPLHRSCPPHTRVATDISEPLAISSASRAAAASSTRCDGESSLPCTPGRNASTRTNRLGSAGSARRSGRDAGVSRRTRAGFDSTFGFELVCRWVVVDGVAAGTDGCWCYRRRLGRDLRGRGRRGLLWRRRVPCLGSRVRGDRGRLRGRVGLRLGGRGGAQNCPKSERKDQHRQEEARGGGKKSRPVAHETGSLRLQALHPP